MALMSLWQWSGSAAVLWKRLLDKKFQLVLYFVVLKQMVLFINNMTISVPLFEVCSPDRPLPPPLFQIPLVYQSHHVTLSLHASALSVLPSDGVLRKVDLEFDLSFQLIRDRPKEKQKHIGRPVGITFIKNGVKTIFTGQSESLFKLRDRLAGCLNQQGFHELIKPLKKLGKGNFGTVYLVQRLQDSSIFAAKSFLKYSTFNNQNGKESLINQIKTMRQLSHPNLLKVIEVYETDNSIYVILERLSGGSLADQFRHMKVFLPSHVKIIMNSLLQAVAYMHQNRYMHRDIKPQNIMFRQSPPHELVLVDFGLATNCDLPQFLFARCGTPGYVAPEVINLVDVKSKYQPICDLFSVGCIFFQILSGKLLFEAKVQNDILRLNKSANIDFKMSSFKQIDQGALQLLKALLEKDPSKRITAKAALQMSYFQTGLEQNLTSVRDVKEPDEGSNQSVKYASKQSCSLKSTNFQKTQKQVQEKVTDTLGEIVVKSVAKRKSRLQGIVQAGSSFAQRLKEENLRREQSRKEIKKEMQVIEKIVQLQQPVESPLIRKKRRKESEDLQLRLFEGEQSCELRVRVGRGKHLLQVQCQQQFELTLKAARKFTVRQVF